MYENQEKKEKNPTGLLREENRLQRVRSMVPGEEMLLTVITSHLRKMVMKKDGGWRSSEGLSGETMPWTELCLNKIRMLKP